VVIIMNPDDAASAAARSFFMLTGLTVVSGGVVGLGVSQGS
jgi:hypothetical protein